MAARFMAALLCGACAAAGQPPEFHTDVNLVSVTAVVRSGAGQLLDNLTERDFAVEEDGVRQNIQFFARRTDLPLSLGLVVDVSGSQEHFLKQHDRDIDTFLRAVLRPTDQAFVVCFGNHLRLVSDFSADPTVIQAGIKQFSKGRHDFPELGPKENRDLGTALYDAVFYSTAKLQKGQTQRRALIVFSDGEENSSEHDLLDAIEAAQATDTLVYAIRYTEQHRSRETARNRYGMRALHHLADLTGGADYDGVGSGLPELFVRIGEELRSLYEMGYASTTDAAEKGFRKLKVSCNRQGATVRTRSGFYVR